MTERKRAAERRHAIARQLQTITDNLSVALFMTDGQRRCVFMNPAAEAMTGFSFKDVQGRVLHDVVHHTRPDGLPYPTSECRINRALLTCMRDQGEEVFVHKDGHFYPVAYTVSAITDGQRRVVGTIIEVRDTTEQHRAAAALQASERERDDAQKRLQKLFDSSVVGIAMANGNGIIDANDAFLAMIRKTRTDVRAGRIDWRAMTAPESRALDDRGIQELMERGECTPFEKEFVLDDGTRLPILVGAALLQRDPPQWVAFAVDITERKRAEAALREADRRKDEFLAMLAHELRNPLGVVTSGIGVLERNAGHSVETTRMLALIRHQAQHLARLLDDLLDVTRITQGRIELRLELVDLRGVVRLVSESEAARFESKAQDIRVSLPDEAVVVRGDPARVRQIVGNILNNACKYTPDGGTIVIELSRTDAHAVLRIADDGVGIAPDDLTRIFGLFSRAQVRSTEPGLGIGLALAKQLVELHKGTIEVSSEGVGQGAVFVVRLPLADALAG